MKFIIEGNKLLRGEIKVSGAKNAALKMIAASILFDGPVTLKNTPDIVDVENMLNIAHRLGKSFKRSQDIVTISGKSDCVYKLPANLTNCLRGSIVFLGPLLAKHGKALLPVPGGCSIGKRPITAHIDILGKLGVKTSKTGDDYYFEVTKNSPRKACLIEKSVTATENAILFLCLGNHNIVLQNCAQEPEIDDLILMLNVAGANIKRVGRDGIKIVGVPELRSVDHNIVGDRIEAGTWMVAGLLLGNPLKISGFDPALLAEPIRIAKRMGGTVDVEAEAIRTKKSDLIAQRITTGVYPLFPTDLQSPFGLLLTQAKGRSLINETLFNDRLKYLDELKLMGAKIKTLSVHKADIIGPTPLTGKHIHTTDLRAGATMVLAGLVAEGRTTVENAQIIDRGYEAIDDKLSGIGANIIRR